MAAMEGNGPLCRYAKEFGASNCFSMMMWNAAWAGHEHVCRLAREFVKEEGLSDIDCVDTMILGAEMGGRERLCVLAKEWGATIF
jgi:hypothetical protein